MDKKNKHRTDEEVRGAIRSFCRTQFGVLDSNFLCQSISVLNPNKPITVETGTVLSEVIAKLQSCRIGGVLVVDAAGKLVGVFTERDCVQKVMGKGVDLDTALVDDFMTREPVSQPPDITTAYALNLMSHGGFRHLPLVDQDNIPIGIISVKDVLDHIVQTFLVDLLDFPESGVDEELPGQS